jgi:glycosyltransferase involved in cell wall biosynthesis
MEDRDHGGSVAATIRCISIIAPMLNEAEHVDYLVRDIALQDFEGDVEFIVADGGSIDDSRERLRRAAEESGLRLTLLENTAGWVSHALNACVEHASGDLVVRLDCHSRYPRDYLRRCAVAAEETGAMVVGGVIAAVGESWTERCVACAMDTPFGGIGFYRAFSGGSLLDRLGGAFGIVARDVAGKDGRIETDTLTYGAFRPEAFQRVGLFDESLRRNQDDEFNLRVRKHGGRVVLDPAIHVYYTPRDRLSAVFRQYFEYGRWKVQVARKHRQLPSPRSLTPAAFVTSAATLGVAGIASGRSRKLLLAELTVYSVLAVAFGAGALRRRKESWGLLPVVVAVFPAFHVGYGAGMLRGCIDAASRVRRRSRT